MIHAMPATDTRPGTFAQHPVFVARGLSKTYQLGEVTVQALRGVDLQIQEGELIAILGPSGSGKSTLLNILGGLDSASAGTASWREHRLDKASERDLTAYRRAHVGFVFQFYNLIPSLTAWENVALVAEIAPSPMDPGEALAMVGMDHRRDHFPAQLSGGEQQRVAVARAIVKRPDVLLCDEPTGALDAATGITVLSAIETINRRLGTTVIIITHNAVIATMAHRVLHMTDGHIAKIDINAVPARPQDLTW